MHRNNGSPLEPHRREQRPTHGGNLAWAAALADCPPAAIVDFSASINPLGPPKSAIAAIQGGLETLAAYPDPNYSQLRSALARHHQLDRDWILPGNGSAELLTWAGRELAQLEVTELVTPAFNDYARALTAFGATARATPLPLDNPDLPLPDFAANTGQRRGLLLNNPHNPTGKIWDRAAILPLLDKFDLVVVDEAFMDFVDPAEQASLVGCVREFDNLVVLRSLTKFYSLPGLRLGYAIAHPERLARWQNWRDPWPVNSLAAAAAIAALADTAFETRTREWLLPARTALWQGLQALPGFSPFPGAANFLLVRCDRAVPPLQLQLLKQHRLLIRDCLSFPQLRDRYFRIAVRLPSENQQLLGAIDDFLA